MKNVIHPLPFSLPKYLFSILFFITLTPSNGSAETMYVSDYLLIRIKDNIEQPYSVVTTVQTDDQVEVIEQKDRYLKIRTEEGKEGWILQHYLKKELPKATVIDQLKEEIQRLQDTIDNYEDLPGASAAYSELVEKNKTLQTDLDAANTRIEELMADADEGDTSTIHSGDDGEIRLNEQLQEENDRLTSLLKEYQTEKQSYSLVDKELQTLKLQHTNLLENIEMTGMTTAEKEQFILQIQTAESQITTLTMENEQLRSRQTIYLFIAGAAVFVGGLLFGKIGGRRKSRISI